MTRQLSFAFALCLTLTTPARADLVFNTNATWNYFKGTAEASAPDPAAWRNIGFDDSSWASGPAPFYYAETLTGTLLSDMKGSYTCVFLRQTFNVASLADVAAMQLGSVSDDGFIAWINGVEVARFNMPAGNIAFNGKASAAKTEPLPFVTNSLPDPASFLATGENVIAIQAFNLSATDTDFQFSARLIAQPPDAIPPTIAAINPTPGNVTQLSQITVTFSEPVQGVNASDLLINGQPATAFAVDADNRICTFGFEPPPYGPVQIGWSELNGIQDFAPPPNPFDGAGPGATWQYTFMDAKPPVVATVIPATNTTLRVLNRIEIHFSEPVTGVDAADLRINGTAAADVIFAAPGVYVFEFPEPPVGPVQIEWIPLHGIKDLAPVPNAFGGGGWSYILDPASAAEVRINEFMAVNQTPPRNTPSVRDEDGDYSDWIELYNGATTAVSLEGWFLTDDVFTPAKWRFPAVVMVANSYMLVWASGKDRTGNPLSLHTNFKLNSTGKYLALLDPDTNVISAFAPAYPPQQPLVSYGRDRVDPNVLGFYTGTNVTPRAANKTSGAGFGPEVHYSRPGGTFTEPFDLTLWTEATNAVIRYVLVTNGTSASITKTNVPTADSPIYSNALPIRGTVQVRARAFVPDLLPGPPTSESYIFINSNILNFSSDLPIIVLHNFGAGTVSVDIDQTGMFALYDSEFDRSSLTNSPDVLHRIGFNIRGSSTAGYAKSSWAVEFWDEFNQGTDVSLLAEPQESDWVLYAPNNFDPGLMHNPVFYRISNDLGRYASRTRFVEVFVKTTAGPLGIESYNGVYVLEEKIKRNSGRLNIAKLEPENTNAPAITGGYLLKIDRTNPNERTFNTPGVGAVPSQSVIYQDPQGIFLGTPQGAPQAKYIQGYFAQFVTNLASVQFTNEVTGWIQYVDPDSWIDHMIVNVTAFNVDALRLSGYFFKDRNKRLEYGPVWDCDRCLGSTDGRDFNPRMWRSDSGDLGTDFFNYPWWGRLFSDTNFWQLYIDRYQDLRKTTLSTSHLNALVDGFAAELNEAQPREQAKWGGMAPPRGVNGQASGTFATEVQWQKNWLASRMEFMDTNFLRQPIFSGSGGPITAGFVLEMVGPIKPANSKIYYTQDGTDPRGFNGVISPSAIEYTGPITLNDNARVFARSFNLAHRNLTGASRPPVSSPWSGPTAETFVAHTPPVVITEIMYHPQNPPAGNTNDADNFEFVEVKNNGLTQLSLNRFTLSGGIQFTFPSLTLNAGQYCVVVKDTNAFVSRYGNGPLIAGVFEGNLANNGARLVLEGGLKEPILDFSYSDQWLPITDGAGFSLVIANANAALDTWGNKASWRVSTSENGSPGAADAAPSAFPAVVVNEALTHTRPPVLDVIELRNTSASEADISGWYLTDDFGTPRKYRIPANTKIAAGGFKRFTETDFNVGVAGFALSAKGDSVYLFSGDAAGNLTGYVHGFDFGAQVMDRTFGRHVTSTGAEQFVTQITSTLNAANTGPRVGPIVISEIMYHPPGFTGALKQRDNTEDEFIELRNVSNAPAPLFDPNFATNTWRLRDAVDFEFPANVTLPVAGYLLVVSFNPTNVAELAAFRARVHASDAVPVFGPFQGRLGNGGAGVELVAPDAPEMPPALDAGFVPYVLMDKVRYESSAPWSIAADGAGASLQRVVETAFGNDVANWTAASPSPGAAYHGGTPPTVTLHPQNVRAVQFQSATFTAAAAGPGTLSYQWLFQGANVPGATKPTLTLTNVQPSQAGDYLVVVFSSAGAVASSSAALTVLLPPTITSQPGDQLTKVGSNATFRVGANSSSTIRYQWRRNGIDVPGATTSTLVVTNVQPDASGKFDSRYSVALTDDIGTVMSREALLLVLVNPVITKQPLSQTVVVGDTVTFRAEATGTTPLGFRWRREKVTAAGAQGQPTFTLTNVQLASAGIWTVVVTNAASTSTGTTSSNAVLTVLSDADGDHMPDIWETANGFNPNDPTDGSLDIDGDLMTNWQEYIAGTDPRDRLSYLKVDRLYLSGGATLLFNAVSNKTYTMQYKDGLLAADWLKLADVNAEETTRTAVVNDPGPRKPSRYYRLITPQLP